MKLRVKALARIVFVSVLCPALAVPSLAASAASTTSTSSTSLDCSGCNVILLSIDTLRADALGAYGSTFGVSPVLDRLAKNAFVLSNAYSPATNTLPSHMSMFSGLHPNRHNVRHFWGDGKLSAGHPTLAELLKRKGYRTAWAWVSPLPSYDPMLTHPGGGHMRGFDTFINESIPLRPGETDALGWLKKNRSEPFFLFLHNYNMHDPYIPSRKTLSRFPGRLGKPYLALEDVRAKVEEAAARNLSAAQSDPHWRSTRAREIFRSQFDVSKSGDVQDLKTLYSLSLHDVDLWFGNFYAELKKLDLLDNTLVVILSDHGEEFMEHGLLSHTQVHEECVRVPLMFLFPKGKGGKDPSVVGTPDVYPTVLDIVGIEVPKGVQGTSLRPLMEGVPRQDYRPAFSERWIDSTYSVRDSTRAYILMRRDGFMEKFYDRINDPGEKKNLIDSSGAEADPYRRLIKTYLGED